MKLRKWTSTLDTIVLIVHGNGEMEVDSDFTLQPGWLTNRPERLASLRRLLSEWAADNNDDEVA